MCLTEAGKKRWSYRKSFANDDILLKEDDDELNDEEKEPEAEVLKRSLEEKIKKKD
jgi:hypothetical protein